MDSYCHLKTVKHRELYLGLSVHQGRMVHRQDEEEKVEVDKARQTKN